MTKQNFKTKKELEQHLTRKYKDLSKARYDELGRGEEYDTISKLTLYYSGPEHIATWNATTRKGWTFQ